MVVPLALRKAVEILDNQDVIAREIPADRANQLRRLIKAEFMQNISTNVEFPSRVLDRVGSRR
ncbi:hypothetical protein [Brevundimonas nasdae]|uniref:Uncharacterized protein n=1 Tax=Brevundimonas nasdae TaxID=172043 RepID=A0ABX8TGT7_9CAUL|nr:hypothetical protein [Brevundimonas nasdae]QYC10174.1 hypothetical protein KWG56_16695 [Brevundimonas nasdae]QYC12963.1 hypothetical protein KWG63_12015 [Brevundimonas nasdae]